MKIHIWIFSVFCILFSLTSCSLKSKLDFESQGKAHLDRLILELKGVHDLEGLKLRKKHLRKRFNQMASFLVQYQEFLDKNPQSKYEPEDQIVITAAALKDELSRILEIQGAADIIIDVQKEAFLQLALLTEDPS